MGRTGKKRFTLKSSNIDPFGKSKEPAGGTKEETKNNLENVYSPRENEKKNKGNIPEPAGGTKEETKNKLENVSSPRENEKNNKGNIPEPAGGTKEETKNKLENVSSPRENEKNKKGNIPERDSRNLSVKTYQKCEYSNINMHQSVDKKSSNIDPYGNSKQPTGGTKEETKNMSKFVETASAAKIIEVCGNLFDCPGEYSLAHCVSEDLSMSTGIAFVFKKRFKRTGRLMDQHKSAGQMAFLEDKGRFIYYLVTKKRSFYNPTLDTLKKSLEEMKSHAVDNSVKDIAIPAMGSGVDWLDSNKLLEILREVFANTEITIHACLWRKRTGVFKPKGNSVIHVDEDLVEMQNDTARIYIGNTMGHVTKEMKLLDTKHKFISEYLSVNHNMGDVFVIQGDHDLTYGFICQDKEFSLSYEAFENCVSQFRIGNKNDNYMDVGIQAFTLDKFDKLLMAKLEILLENGVGEGITIWICWPEELKHLMPKYPSFTSVTTEGTSYD